MTLSYPEALTLRFYKGDVSDENGSGGGGWSCSETLPYLIIVFCFAFIYVLMVAYLVQYFVDQMNKADIDMIGHVLYK